MSSKRVLVTGAAGLLGGYIVDALAPHCAVSGFDRRRGRHEIEWHVGDITDAAAVSATVKGQDAVIHAAAVPNIWSADGETIVRVNTMGTWLVLNAAEQAGVRRVVLCSSDSVIGFTVAEGRMLPPLYLPIDAAHPRRPTDPYALSKLLGEEMGRSFADRAVIEVLVLRPVFIAYPEMYPEIAARAADPARYRGPMAGGPSAAGGGPVWHHVDPRDAGRAFRLALEVPYSGFDTFVISAATTLAPEPTLERLRRVVGHLPEIRELEVYHRHPFAPLYDLSHARDRLGFTPQFDARTVALAAEAAAR